jgi:hypothetical protein
MQILQKQIKHILGWVSNEDLMLQQLRKFYLNTTSEKLAVNKLNSKVYQITAPNGQIKTDLFYLKTGKSSVKFKLIVINN